LSATERWSRGPRLDLLPLLDVVFLVLTVFIYSVVTTIRAQAVPVDLPLFDSGAESDLSTVVVVTILDDGTIAAWGEDLTPEQLSQRVRRAREAEPETVVLINGSARAAYADVARALDSVRSAGQQRIYLAGVPDGPSSR